MSIIGRVLLAVVLVLLLVSPVVTVSSAQSNSLQELVGLWKAKKRFGQDARGPLIIQKDGAAYVADIVGRRMN